MSSSLHHGGEIQHALLWRTTTCHAAQLFSGSFTPNSPLHLQLAVCRHCPALDIALPAAERVFGTCTDAALYIIHAGGRLIPMPADVEAYDSYCGPQTARWAQKKCATIT
jgi:hypothetical protein